MRMAQAPHAAATVQTLTRRARLSGTHDR